MERGACSLQSLCGGDKGRNRHRNMRLVAVVQSPSHVQHFAIITHELQPPGSSLHGLLQARILEWVAIPFSQRPSQPRDQTHASCTRRTLCC